MMEVVHGPLPASCLPDPIVPVHRIAHHLGLDKDVLSAKYKATIQLLARGVAIV
jgi:hypothetical protein